MNQQPDAKSTDESLSKQAEPSQAGQTKPKKRPRSTDKQDDKSARLQRELSARLHRLRTTTKDITRVYLAKLESAIVNLSETVGTGDGSKKKRWKTATLQKMNDLLDDLNVKPEKGRRKDLKKIELLLKSLDSLLSKK